MEKYLKNNMKKKILIFTEWVYPGKEKTDLKIVFELKKFFPQVDYAVLPLSLFIQKKVGFPGVDDKYKNDKEFKLADTIWLNSKNEIYNLISNYDIVIFGNCRNVSDLIFFSRIRNKIVIIHRNPSNFDNILSLTPTIYFVDNKLNFDQTNHNILKKNIFKVSANDKMIIAGSVQYDAIFEKKIEKKDLYNNYKLNKKKDLVLFMPSSPASLTFQNQSDYLKIVLFLKKNFNVLIKNHPSDFFKRKVSYYSKKKMSHEAILSDDKLFLEPKDFESALLNCKYVFSMETTGFVPVNMSRKPIIYIDRFKYLINNNNSNLIPDYLYSNIIKINQFKPNKKTVRILKKINNSITIKLMENYWSESNKYYFYGCDISFEKLKKSNCNFIVKKFNNNLFKLNKYQKSNNTEHIFVKHIIKYIKNYNLKNNLIISNFVKLLFFKFLKSIKI